MDNEAVAELAFIAHRLWCANMCREGWRHGPRFDPRAKIHDALTEFAQLSDADRRHVQTAIQAEALDARLLAAVSYPRGADRELTLGDMRPGLPVRSAAKGAPLFGRIESWESEGAALTLIRVRWSDGSRSTHEPVFRELAQVGEASTQ